MSILLAIGTGTILGYIIERGDFCFHSTWRDLLRDPARPDLFRAYLLLLLISIPLVQGLIALGLINPWIPPLAWQANLVGGLIFGMGMVVTQSCITGIFYKFGHGMLGMLVALATWSIGDIMVYSGPLRGWRDSLNANPISINGQSATVSNGGGLLGVTVLVIAAGAAIYYLWNSPRNGRDKLWGWWPLGLVMGGFMSVAWLLADWGGSNYSFGTSGVPNTLFQIAAGRAEAGNLWIPLTLVSIVLGAFIAARSSGTLWVRGETGRRYTELAVGGLMMGFGAGIAGGCNLGHSMVGVSLLSLGSILTTIAIIAGVFIGDRVYKAIM